MCNKLLSPVRPKADVKKVGVIVNGRPRGFVFDCKGVVPGMELSNGQWYYGGYTVDELQTLVDETLRFV